MPPLLLKDSKGRSPNWIHCYTSADGRRLKKSTGTPDRKKAEEIARGVERAETLAKQSSLTEVRARSLLNEILERTQNEPLQSYTAENWFEEWLRGKYVSKAEGTHAKYSRTVESFIEHVGARANLNIAAISTSDVSTYRDKQLSARKHPNTVRYIIKQLRIPFNAAVRQGIITHSPAASVELPPKVVTTQLSGDSSSRSVFSLEQVAALIKAATERHENGKPVFADGDEWKGLILMAYYTAARLTDAANMVWNSIDLPAKLITYRAKKTGKIVRVPIHEELEQHLLSLPAPDSGKAFVFPKLAQRATGGRNGLSMAFSRIMARAGVVGEVIHRPSEGGVGRTIRSLTFHSLRHTANSAMANAGISQELRMKLTGHVSQEMNREYTHHELEPLRVAIGSIPKLHL